LTISAWRITKQKHVKSAFSGEGARLYGGRWNSQGVPVVYVAQSQALAVLEVLVHLDSPVLLGTYALIQFDFEEGHVSNLTDQHFRRIGGVTPLLLKHRRSVINGQSEDSRPYFKFRAF
jgi:RES domain-containing protein